MVFNLGNKNFKTKKETTIYIQQLVARNHFKNIKYNDDDFYVLNDLIKLHPKYKEKIGDGIEHFHIKKHPKYIHYCIWIKQKNKEELVSFSWNECLKKNKTTPIQDFKKALRITIEPQIINFKNSIEDKKCELCSSKENIHVDHIIHFEKLIEDFLKINRENIPILFYKNKLLDLEFKEEDLIIKNNWYNFHLENATLRLLCQTCNLSRPKYKL